MNEWHVVKVASIQPSARHLFQLSLEVNDQEVILRRMPHQRGVLLVLRDDDSYSHGGRVPENG